MPDVPDLPDHACARRFQRTVARDPDERGAADARRQGHDHLARVRRPGPPHRRRACTRSAYAAGHTVGMMLTNRPEFALVDAAAMHLGAAPFSVYNTSPPEQIAYLFANAGNRVVVCEAAFLDAGRRRGCRTLDHVVCVDADRPGHDDAGRSSRRARRRRASTSRRPGGPSSPTTW